VAQQERVAKKVIKAANKAWQFRLRDQVRGIILERGITTKRFAQAIGMSGTVYSKIVGQWEVGCPSLETLLRMLAILGKEPVP
jgi:predicted transcriptional regulator